MTYRANRFLLLLAIPAAFCIPMLAGSITSVSAQLTDEEIFSTMEGSNLPPGYFEPDPIFSLDNLPSPNPWVNAAKILLRPSKAGSQRETSLNDPADTNGDAMKDSSYPYMPDTWRDSDNDGMPDQSYDSSYDEFYDF
ncbi:MAG: hypothetical protein AAF171_10340 [Cyanobacteria bacterium P01_A01_bin.116]